VSQGKKLGKRPLEVRSLSEFPGPARSVASNCCGRETLIGGRLRAFRRQKGQSIRALAEKCGISVNTLSLIENNRSSPNVHTLNLLASGLGVQLVSLFEQEKREQKLVYQREGQRDLIQFTHGTLEKLGEGLPPLGAEPILVTLNTDQQGEIGHSGREFIYCLEGKATCWIAGQAYVLSPGDSLLFDAETPHRWTNARPRPSRLLVLFCPMEARDRPAERHLDI